MVTREVVRALTVWDVSASTDAVLEPGSVLHECRIVRGAAPGEAYLVHFQCESREYRCPLYRFQPRTAGVEIVPALTAVAV